VVSVRYGRGSLGDLQEVSPQGPGCGHGRRVDRTGGLPPRQTAGDLSVHPTGQKSKKMSAVEGMCSVSVLVTRRDAKGTGGDRGGCQKRRALRVDDVVVCRPRQLRRSLTCSKTLVKQASCLWRTRSPDGMKGRYEGD